MNIVLVTPLLDVGGGQRYVTVLANYWAKTGHNVTIIVLREGEVFYEISNKVTIIKLTFRYSGKYSKILSGYDTIRNLRKKIKQIQPDFVLSILSTTNILTIFSTLFLKMNIVVRDAMSPTRNRKFLETVSRKYLYRKADGIIAQTPEIKRFIERKTGSKNIKIIPNPVRQFNQNEGIKREKIILNVGALISRKGQRYFIEACARINDPDWKFVILGDGLGRKNLEKQIKELNIQDKIELAGSVKNVDDWLLKSSIFVFPSLTEGLPNALIEAMAAGLPCISFDCETGPRNLIEDGQNGFLVPVGDIDLLTSRIKTLMFDFDLRNKFSDEAIKTTEKLSVSKIAEEVLEFCITN